ncbi:MAG: PIN domain nuclease [Sphingomonas sp.]
MILADTSVWIGFFRGSQSHEVDFLADLIERGRIVIGDLILTEMLQGCDTDREFREVRRVMRAFPVIEISDAGIAVQAARNYRKLRARGFTVRKTIDTLIATRCIEEDMPLLYSDRDFDPFVRHLGLRSATNLE